MLKVPRKWTFDAALDKHKQSKDNCENLIFKRDFDNNQKNENRINVWRRTKDESGRIYLWNILTMETKWPESQTSKNISLSNKKFSYCDIESIHNNKIFIQSKNK